MYRRSECIRIGKISWLYTCTGGQCLIMVCGKRNNDVQTDSYYYYIYTRIRGNVNKPRNTRHICQKYASFILSRYLAVHCAVIGGKIYCTGEYFSSTNPISGFRGQGFKGWWPGSVVIERQTFLVCTPTALCPPGDPLIRFYINHVILVYIKFWVQFYLL